MTYQEMVEKWDTFGAFLNYKPVSWVKKLGDIPEEYHDNFPDLCVCGSENIISNDFTIMQCCDPKCPCKQAYGLSLLFKRNHCKGIGDSVCQIVYSMIRNMNEEEHFLHSTSYVEILAVERNHFTSNFILSADGQLFFNYVEELKRRSYTFAEMISCLGLPEFDTSAHKLFDGMNSFSDFKTTIMSEGGIAQFCINRGVSDPMKMFWLKVSIEDIFVAACVFRNIRAVGVCHEKVCITGSIHYEGTRMTKASFINMCNALSRSRSVQATLLDLVNDSSINEEQFLYVCNKYGVEADSKDSAIEKLKEFSEFARPLLEVQLTQAKMTAPYIIGDTPSSSDKYLTGLRRGIEIDSDGSERKVLVTSAEYVAKIKEMVDKWNQEVYKKLMREASEYSLEKSNPEEMEALQAF